MLNNYNHYIVYLDPDTLKFMFYSYTKSRNYPVMNKLYSLIREGYLNNLIITPVSFDHISPCINDNKIEAEFLNMMGSLGQMQFHQRFTVRTLQLIRVINSFFNNDYKKPLWRDAFSSDPDEKLQPGFNKHLSISVQNVLKAVEREKNNSKVYYFIENFKNEKPLDKLAKDYFSFLWEQFPDLIKPYLPADGDYEYYMKKFLEYDEIREIPEYYIISSLLYPLIETYGIQDVEYGLKDDLLLAAENAAAYMPFCNFFVTTVDIAELIIMTGIDEVFNVKVYDHNESSLYKLIDDLNDVLKRKKSEIKAQKSETIFRKSKYKI